MVSIPMNRVPLAWKNLTHEVRRLLLAVAGIGFAVLLICMQLGFRGALFDSTVQLIRSFNADLVMTSPAKSVLTAKEMFTRRHLASAQACPGVVSADPLYLEVRGAFWMNPETHQEHPLRAIAFDPTQKLLKLPEVQVQQSKLLVPGTVLFDRASKSDFGHPQPGTTTELAGKRVEVVGLYTLGTDFADDGGLIMSDATFREFFFPPLMRADALSRVDFGLIKVAQDADPAEIRDRLNRILPDDVIVRTVDEYVAIEQDFWGKTTPIGYVFTFGAALGFIVGVIICYQILYSDIADHLPEYATLKAMGYRNRFFFSVVLQESLLLSILGFIPGLIVSQLLYSVLASATGLLLQLSIERAAIVFLLTAGMCIVSGCLAIRRLLLADPAELFR